MEDGHAEAPVAAVVGPTATGKTDLGVALALALGGEVVNADAMQLYRGMDVGTAKATEVERRGVPHQLLDVLDVTEQASVAAYQRDARAAVAGCRERGLAAVLVGGSGLYVRAVLDPLEFPGTDAAVRARLEAELDAQGSAALHGRLVTVDPAAAERILPSNGRRVVRALEVVELTGRSFTASLPHEHAEPVLPAVVIGLVVERPVLDERIVRRVDRMWSGGFVDEVRALEPAGIRDGVTASRAVGYRQVLDLLAGACTETEAREATVIGTRRLARRQATWFGNDPRVRWLDPRSPTLLDDALALVAAGPVQPGGAASGAPGW